MTLALCYSMAISVPIFALFSHHFLFPHPSSTKMAMVVCPCCLFSFDTPSLFRDHLQQVSFSSDHSHSLFLFGCPFCDIHQLIGAKLLADHLANGHADLLMAEQRTFDGHLIPELEANPTRNELPKAIINSQIAKQCEFCGRKFSKAWDLKRHRLTHTDERSFVCPECGRGFRLKTTLTDHMKTHGGGGGGSEQFGCSVCGKQFLSRSAMRLHLRQHTGETPFPCSSPDCTMAFRTRKLMLTHFRNSHELGDEAEEDEEKLLERWEMERESAFNELVKLNRQERRGGSGRGGKPGEREQNAGKTAKKQLKRSEKSAFAEFCRAPLARGQQRQLEPNEAQIQHMAEISEGSNGCGASNGKSTSQQPAVYRPFLPLTSSPVIDVAAVGWAPATSSHHNTRHSHHQLQAVQQPPQNNTMASSAAVYPRALTPNSGMVTVGEDGRMGPGEFRQLFAHSCLPFLNYEPIEGPRMCQ